jgi:hypothetical protein
MLGFFIKQFLKSLIIQKSRAGTTIILILFLALAMPMQLAFTSGFPSLYLVPE